MGCLRLSHIKNPETQENATLKMVYSSKKLCRVLQPWQSPYTSMDNNPINLNDVLGDKVDKFEDKKEYEKSDSEISGKSTDSKRKIDQKVRKFRKAETKLQKKTGFEGEELRNEVYKRNRNKSWLFVQSSDGSVSGSDGFTPTGDIMDIRDGVRKDFREVTTSSMLTSSDFDGSFEEVEIEIGYGENIDVKVTQLGESSGETEVSISQEGVELKSGKTSESGDSVEQNNISEKDGSKVTVDATLSSESIRSIHSESGREGESSLVKEIIQFKIDIKRVREGSSLIEQRNIRVRPGTNINSYINGDGTINLNNP